MLLADGIPPASFVHSGIDLEAVRRTRPGDIRARLGLPHRDARGRGWRLVGHKDHATLVDAAAALQRTRPDHLGSSPGKDRCGALEDGSACTPWAIGSISQGRSPSRSG